ncbi:MAG: LL-diaminopimelate aminotransferase [Candidatus Omnitrophica bacterium]|nr:LL-diaminopimelate aminotransferase [Candidatus Omnitrophota bacterium]
MEFQRAKVLNKLPPYLFVEIDKAKRKARQEGKDLIDLGIGDPQTPTPQHIIEALYEAAKDPANHKYALDAGMPQLRQEIAEWFKKWFNIRLDPDNEILPTIGSKEAIAHLPFAYLNKGDINLVPDPCYPPYRNATILAGGRPYLMPLLAENNFLPDLKKIPAPVLKKSKIIYFNYPNNPTAAVASKAFYKDAVKFARKHKLIVASDLAYSQMCYDGYKAPSMLEIPGAKEVVIEFHSLSKTYNMTGWRIGWACGNKDIISALAKIKSNIDSGIFGAIQIAGISALKTRNSFNDEMNNMYQERRDVLIQGLKKLGWPDVRAPKATFYVWTKIPFGKSSVEVANILLQKAGIVVTPGIGFGCYGEGFIRFALTQKKERIEEALKRLSFL